MFVAFMAPPSAYRPQKPEKPEQSKQPEVTRMSQSVTLKTGAILQKARLAICVIVLMFGLLVYGIVATVFPVITR